MNKISDKIKEATILYQVVLGASYSGNGYVCTNISPLDLFFYGLKKLRDKYQTEIPKKLDKFSNELSPAAISFQLNGVKVAMYSREVIRKMVTKFGSFPTKMEGVIDIYNTSYAMEFIEDLKNATNNALDLTKYINISQ